MAPRKPSPPQMVRRIVTVEAAKLALARERLKIPSDAEVLRVALDLLLQLPVVVYRDEEE